MLQYSLQYNSVVVWWRWGQCGDVSNGVERRWRARPQAKCCVRAEVGPTSFILNTTSEWDDLILVTGSGAVV